MKDTIFNISPTTRAEEAEKWTKAMTVEEAQAIGMELEGTTDVTRYECFFVIRGKHIKDGEWGRVYTFLALVKATAYWDAQGGYWLESLKWEKVKDEEKDSFKDDSLRLELEELLEGMFIRADEGMTREIFLECNGWDFRDYSLDTMQAVSE